MPQVTNETETQTQVETTRSSSRALPRNSARSKLTAARVHQQASSATAWETNFAALVEYKNQKGHMIIPKEETQLFRFVKNLRQNHKNRRQQRQLDRSVSPFTLTAARIQQLDSIGFSWNPREETWRRKYEELRAYWEEHGHADLPPPPVEARVIESTTTKGYLDCDCSRHNEHEKDDCEACQYKDLRSWVFYQRQCYRNKSFKPLSEEQIRLLEEIDFRWTPQEEAWWKNFRELKDFHETHGHFEVKGRENHRLRCWKNNLRRQCKEYVLTVAMEGTVDGVHISGLNLKRIEALRRIGFCWLPPNKPGPITEVPPEDIFLDYQ